jgi:hypothetical protein
MALLAVRFLKTWWWQKSWQSQPDCCQPGPSMNAPRKQLPQVLCPPMSTDAAVKRRIKTERTAAGPA